MIQLNLLPDVKLEFIKAERQQRQVASVAVLVSLVAVALLVLLLAVDGLQKKHLSDLTANINSESSQLQAEPQIDKILTVQNQLASLTALHAGEPAAARLFNYLNEVTPASVNITSFNIDFTQQTATVTGTADALSSVNQYVDTLKTTTYTSGTNSSALPAFSNVVLSSFGVSASTSDPTQAASYTVTLAYDKDIFDITQTINLTVPSSTSTRTSSAQPTDLFKAAPATPAASSKGSN